jgi:hypothetical protein
MMTMKKIALALLATSAMAAQECAPESPWGAQSNFAVEISGGAATMGGSPYSNTVAPEFQQTWNDLVVSNDQTATSSAFNIEINSPSGYSANWNKMAPSANRLGFAGQLNLHYTAVQGHFAGGVYAGVGYNGAHSSSTIQNNFNNLVYKNVAQIFLQEVSTAYGAQGDSYTYPNLPTDEDAQLATKPQVTNSLLPIANSNNSMPMAKATVSSGLMFSAGARMGAMIGNVFPHFRLGWAIYQLKAHMTNQMPAGYSVTDNLFASANGAVEVVEGEGLQMIASTGGEANMGVGQNFGGIGTLNNLPSLVKISSKGSKWTNAITLGGGVDWAFQKMTLGFYYQAAICQRVTFDKWNKEISAGLTSSIVNFPTTFQGGIVGVTKLNSGGVVNTYGEAMAGMSISPVIHTVMISAKYVMNKA